MTKGLLTLLLASVLALPISVAMFAQETPAKTKAAKEARWDGTVIRSNPDKSTLTVRKLSSTAEMTVQYDASTKWVSQEHGSKSHRRQLARVQRDAVEPADEERADRP